MTHNTNQSQQPPSVLNNFDFTAIEDLDPSLGKFEPVRRQLSNFLLLLYSPGTHSHV